MDAIIGHFPTVYFVTFCAAIFIVAVWEGCAARRPLSAPLRARWIGNFTVSLVDNGVILLLIPLSTLSAAIAAAHNGLGLFNTVRAPSGVAFLSAILLIDLARYAFHRALHRAPFLWRIHRIHHSDPDYDFTTGLRFHPFPRFPTAASLQFCAVFPPAQVSIYLMDSERLSGNPVHVRSGYQQPLAVKTQRRWRHTM